MIDITMPRLSDTMEEGAIATWHKQEGDEVAEGDVLVEIETDKATMEYEAYEAGTLAKILVQEGELVSIGTPIAQLDDGSSESSPSQSDSGSASGQKDGDSSDSGKGDDSDEQAETGSGSGEKEPQEAEADSGAGSGEEAETEEAPAAPSQGSGERRIASPLVRRLARENELDLSGVQGSGPGGRIVRADIEGLLAGEKPQKAAQEPAAERASGDDKRGSEKVKIGQVRRVIARRLGESKRTIPHFTVTARADAEEFMAFRSKLNAQLVEADRAKVSVNDLLVKAVAVALRQHPEVNASYVGDDADHTLLHHRVNIGIAVASDNGLVVPVVADADRLSLTDLGAEAKRLVGLAGDKKLTVDQMSGGTFTISNLGMFGVEEFTAIINPPEAAILAVGGTAKEAVVVDGEVVPHYVMRYTLCADHRIVDGALAAQFLKTLTGLVENPWTILV